MKIHNAVWLCCVLCVGCAVQPLPPPVEKPQGLIRFSAWYTSRGVEVPLQGVVRLQRDLQSAAQGAHLERLGVVMSHGATVGVTVWDAEGRAQRKPGDFPGAYGLLTATEDCVTTLLRVRGIAVPGAAPSTSKVLRDNVQQEARTEPEGAADAFGPLEMFCRHDESQVTVQITEEQR